jgi:Ca2+-binding RTX toxin-like protein
MTTFTGNAGDDSFTGGAANDIFNIFQGGNDTAVGGDGSDKFNLGAAFTRFDSLDGGTGSDTLFLSGDYSVRVTFLATTMVNIEKITLATGFTYNLRTHDATVAAGALLTVDGSTLGAGNILNFDGQFELDGNFTVKGGAADDFMRGGAGVDSLDGGAGQDQIRGLLGDDKLAGGDGNDYLNGNAGKDNFAGGAGFDRVSLFDVTATQGVIADLRIQKIKNDGFGNVETMSSIEALGDGTRFADKFYGDDNANMLIGGFTDSLYGFAGSDWFQIDAAPAVLDGGDGIDTITVFTQTNYVDLDRDGIADIVETTDGVIVDLATNMIVDDGFGNSSTLVNIENLGGSSGVNALGDEVLTDDILIGNGVDNILAGGNGADVLSGGAGNDKLYGDGSFFSPTFAAPDAAPVPAVVDDGEGNDILKGGAGDDFIDGGLGADTLTGGDGVDTFYYETPQDSGAESGIDILKDFQSGVDKIDLPFTVLGVDPDVAFTGIANLATTADAAHLAAWHAVIATNGTKAFLIIDANGVAGYQEGQDMVIKITPATTVVVTDFV